MMVLAVDIGNTNIVLGGFVGDELSFVIQFGESFRQEAEDADGTNMETKAKSREKNEYKRVITLKNPAVSATTR